jgi:hypothetical protein
VTGDDALRTTFEAGLPLCPVYPSNATPAELLSPTLRYEPAGIVNLDVWLDEGFDDFTILTGVGGRNGRRYVGLDVDRKGGRDGFRYLEALGLDPERGFSTPGGGLHYVFETRLDRTRVLPTCELKTYPGIE